MFLYKPHKRSLMSVFPPSFPFPNYVPQSTKMGIVLITEPPSGESTRDVWVRHSFLTCLFLPTYPSSFSWDRPSPAHARIFSFTLPCLVIRSGTLPFCAFLPSDSESTLHSQSPQAFLCVRESRWIAFQPCPQYAQMPLLPAFGSLFPNLSSFKRRRCAQSYYSLKFQGSLLFMGGHPFSKEKGGGT